MTPWISPDTHAGGAVPPPAGFGPKLDHANSPVAASTSHGTIAANTDDGVTSSRNAPAMPPTRLMIASTGNDRRAVPASRLRPA